MYFIYIYQLNTQEFVSKDIWNAYMFYDIYIQNFVRIAGLTEIVSERKYLPKITAPHFLKSENYNFLIEFLEVAKSYRKSNVAIIICYVRGLCVLVQTGYLQQMHF
jgi:hypothetical protein